MTSVKAKFDCPICKTMVSFTRTSLESGVCRCGHALTPDQCKEVESALDARKLERDGARMMAILKR